VDPGLSNSLLENQLFPNKHGLSLEKNSGELDFLLLLQILYLHFPMEVRSVKEMVGVGGGLRLQRESLTQDDVEP
jgi:hypothetical protein